MTNEGRRQYAYYGGRGITICKRWDSFEAFREDMGERPHGTSLERRDNEKGYEPDNCRWATRHEQMRNTRHNRVYEFMGKTMILKDWAKEIGIEESTLRYRLEHWPLERALTEPAGPSGTRYSKTAP